MAQFSLIKENPNSTSTRQFLQELSAFSIIEDINLTNNRIVIDKQCFDVNTLAHLPGEQWYFTNRDVYTVTPYFPGAGLVQSIGSMYLYNGSVSTSCPAENAVGANEASGVLRWPVNNYHLYLDPAYPVRPFIKFASNNIFYSGVTTPNADATVSAANKGLLFGPDITNGSIYTGSFAGTSVTYASFGNQFLYEDVTNGNLWSMVAHGGSNTVIYASNNYQGNSTTVTVTAINNIAGSQYFLGLDTSNNPYWVYVNHAVANEPISVQSANGSLKALLANSITANVPATSNAQLYNMAIPSNLRTDSSSRKVFYTMHWSSTNTLLPVRYIWNPTALNTVTKTDCTLTYPGANTYANYGAHFANTGAISTLGNIYACRPYQFTVGATNYITFTTFDTGAGYVANSATRFANTFSRAWLTYSIGSVATSNDNVLTYHSSITANTIQEFPHNWMPVPGTSGNTLAVATHADIRFLQFDTTAGWQIKNKYLGRSTGFGFDQTNRMWAIMADTANNAGGSIHIITPNSNTAVPTSVSIVYANTNLVYTGTTISTTAALNAYDQSNNRMVANVSLTIDGGSMTFSDGSKTKSYATSSSADTTVNLSVIGGGVSVINSSVNI